MNEFKEQGMGSFERNGFSSSQEVAVDKENDMTFEARAEKLMNYAEKVAHHERTAKLVRGLITQVGGVQNLNEGICEQFSESNADYFDEGPAVLAVALVISREDASLH